MEKSNKPDTLPDRPDEADNEIHGFDTGPFGILTLAVYMLLVPAIVGVVILVVRKLFF